LILFVRCYFDSFDLHQVCRSCCAILGLPITQEPGPRPCGVSRALYISSEAFDEKYFETPQRAAIRGLVIRRTGRALIILSVNFLHLDAFISDPFSFPAIENILGYLLKSKQCHLIVIKTPSKLHLVDDVDISAHI
jgi:hypothetical protein